ncbi:hypothetical protein FF38_07589 [Lucilia cuprina]|uniref:Uncharacterized protein n=1 Tax=Lucilia cuprina TaxID=7375 RepID=A0A0L0C1V3_LUCCU|nr:hypothetical protein FF38_07589 [Lucilia cuprina]
MKMKEGKMKKRQPEKKQVGGAYDYSVKLDWMFKQLHQQQQSNGENNYLLNTGFSFYIFSPNLDKLLSRSCWYDVGLHNFISIIDVVMFHSNDLCKNRELFKFNGEYIRSILLINKFAMKSFILVAVLLWISCISGEFTVKTYDKFLEQAYAAATGSGYGVAPIDLSLCTDKCLFSCCPDKNLGPCLLPESGGYGDFTRNYAVYAVPPAGNYY